MARPKTNAEPLSRKQIKIRGDQARLLTELDLTGKFSELVRQWFDQHLNTKEYLAQRKQELTEQQNQITQEVQRLENTPDPKNTIQDIPNYDQAYLQAIRYKTTTYGHEAGILEAKTQAHRLVKAGIIIPFTELFKMANGGEQPK